MHPHPIYTLFIEVHTMLPNLPPSIGVHTSMLLPPVNHFLPLPVPSATLERQWQYVSKHNGLH